MSYQPLNKAYKIFLSDPHLNSCFQYNEFSEDIEFREVPEWRSGAIVTEKISDDDLTMLKLYLTITHEIEPTKTVLGEICYIISQQKKYHPIKQYIEKEKWDGIKRIDCWLIKSLGCEDNVYVRDIGSKFLIAAVNRIYNPGCKFDHMMILEGKQGIGKSTLLEELASKWYLDTTFENKDKDLVDSMNHAFIAEISELSGMNKKDVNWMRAFITRRIDDVRLSYAARSKKFKRKTVLVGTCNPSGNNTYLRDDTGNRRFWPVECSFVDLEYIKKNKHQLWAEAYEGYKKKERYYLDSPESLKILQKMHNDREFQGPNQFKVEQYLRDSSKNFVTTEELIERCLKITSTDDRILGRAYSIMGIQLKKMGWIKGTGIEKHKYYNPKGLQEEQPLNEQINWEE